MSKEQSANNLIIETVKERVCDNLCRYPVQIDSDTWDEIQDEICGRCPLDMLDLIK